MTKKETKTNMSNETKAKIKHALSGIVKLTPEQEKAVKEIFNTNDTLRIAKVEKLVARRVLYALTGLEKYAPRTVQAQRAMRNKSLNEVLFS